MVAGARTASNGAGTRESAAGFCAGSKLNIQKRAAAAATAAANATTAQCVLLQSQSPILL